MSEDTRPMLILVRKQGLSWVRQCGRCGQFDVSASQDEHLICDDCRKRTMVPIGNAAASVITKQ